jgi:protein-S-isoprenylcysteine O-methyltransferase Ste14
MNGALKSKLYDLAAAMPMVFLLCVEIVGALYRIAQVPEPRWRGGLTICALLAEIVSSAVLIVMLVIRRPPLRKAHGPLPRLAAIVGLALPPVILALPPAALTPAMAAFSSAIILAGIIASIFVILRLGRSFSVFPQARGLVTDGPYRFIRHPLYLAELVIVFGIMWEFEQPWAFLLMLAVIAAQIPRMHFEEEVLTEAFPSYRDYVRRTARLLPGLY